MFLKRELSIHPHLFLMLHRKERRPRRSDKSGVSRSLRPTVRKLEIGISGGETTFRIFIHLAFRILNLAFQRFLDYD